MKEQVTPEELLDIVKPYLLEKINKNAHKDNPLARPMFNLLARQNDELGEKALALSEYSFTPTEKRMDELIYEIADCMIFEMFQIGKVLGIKELIRG